MDYKEFRLNEAFTVECRWKKTRNGFKHTATILLNGRSVYKANIYYLNRTGESYDFQSVLHKAIDAHFSEERAAVFKKEVDEQAEKGAREIFDPVKLACLFGELTCKTPEEKANWKKRMIGTIPGIEFPEEFDNLPEEERERRLNKALEVL